MSVLIAVVMSVCLWAQPGDKPSDVSGILRPIIAKHKVPGMAAACVSGWKIESQGVAGVRKSGGMERITLEDKFHLGSDTKAMTATLCAMLVEDGVLKWETTLSEAFPDVTMDEGFRKVTLEQLLYNRGGVPADLQRDGLWGELWNFKGSPMDARAKLLAGVVKNAPEAAPGSKFIYSNAGFAIAGHMAERATKTPWEELMRKRLFDRLQMFSVGFGAPGEKATVDQPRGHRTNGTPVEPGPSADNPVAIGPAGIVHCTIGDWSKFVALHLRGAQGDAKLLKAESFKKLQTAAPGEDKKYAMGWGVESRPWAGPGERVLTHAGSNTMWFCVVWIAPEKDFAVLAACNMGGDAGTRACDEAVSMLIRDHVARERKPEGR